MKKAGDRLIINAIEAEKFNEKEGKRLKTRSPTKEMDQVKDMIKLHK